VIDPREDGVSRSARPFRGWGEARNAGRLRRRVAFVTAIPILLAGGLVLAGGLAWARGEKVWAPWDPVTEVAPTPAFEIPADVKPREARDARAGGRAVCVRLCDGSFFPSATSSGGDEACAAQCPDAPTARYTEPAGSDRIEEAVSTHGALYSALPTANRYQSATDTACRCHRSQARDYSAAALNDPTLRKGDVVVTPEGFLVFQGAKTRSIKPSDFVALSQARSLPNELRATLLAMEHANALLPQVADRGGLQTPIGVAFH